MRFRGLAIYGAIITLSAFISSPGFADGNDDEIPAVGDQQMNLLRDYDPDEAIPPPPPFHELAEEARQALKKASLTALQKFQQTSWGQYFQKELIRREAVCGKKYTWDIDSVTDYTSSPTDWMPARVKVLADPQEAFLAKYLAIKNAKCEIWVNTYIFNDAPTTKTLAYELGKAIERGVNVRFTIDSSGSASGTFDLSAPFHSDLKAIHFANPGMNSCTGKPATVDTVIFNPQLRLTNLIDATVAGALGATTRGRTSLDINRRSHDKILLVDPQDSSISLAIVGGRNWTDSYYGMPKPDSRTYEDMEVLVRDDSSKTSRIRLIDTIGAHANRLFCHKGNRWLYRTRETPNRMEEPSGKSSSFHAGHDELLARPEVKKILDRMTPEYNEAGLTSAMVMWGNEIENIRRMQSDADQNPDRLALRTDNPESIIDNSRDLISRAKRSIHIVSPYVYLSHAEQDALKSWAMDKPGRELFVVSNSLMTSDNIPAQTIVDFMVAPGFLTEGKLTDGRAFTPDPALIAFFELGKLDSDRLAMNANNPFRKPYGKLHAKYWTIDGEISFVGSHNFDPRSRYYNSEVGFFIRSKKIAADLEKKVKETLNRSYVWDTANWKKMIGQHDLDKKRNFQKHLLPVLEKFPIIDSLI